MLLVMLAAEAEADGSEIDWFEQLDAIGRGDVTALARVRRLVSSQLMRMGAYAQQSSWDDFAQEVVIRVWRAHRDGKIRNAHGLPAFVRTTTRNAFIDWARSHHREVDLPDEAVNAQHDDPSGERPLDPAMQLALRGAIDALSERHREVIEALYLEGLSYDEAAAKLERPRGTVNRLQREAMASLRERLLPADEAGGENGRDGSAPGDVLSHGPGGGQGA